MKCESRTGLTTIEPDEGWRGWGPEMVMTVVVVRPVHATDASM